MPLAKEIVSTDQAPGAVGPYSQAMKVGELVFVSGQIALDRQTGQMVEGDIRVQTRTALTNLSAVLSAVGSSLEKVVKTIVFITNMDEFALVNEVYGEFFSDQPPARSCVEVSRLPKGARVEIEAVAVC